MKKVARLRTSPTNNMFEDQEHQNILNEPTMVRTTGRIKKPKAVFDPSDNYLPRAQRLSVSTPVAAGGASASNQSQDRRSSNSRMSTASSDSNSLSKEVCVVCSKRESKRTSFATKNRLISCMECESKIHKLCLKVDFEDFELLRQKYKCESCTPCSICHKMGHSENLDVEILVCSTCTKMYHNHCFQPRTLKAGEEQPRDWKCPDCTYQTQESHGTNLPVKKIREIIGDQAHPASSITKSIPDTPTSNNCSESYLKRPLNMDSPKHEERPTPEDVIVEDIPEGEKRAKTVNSASTAFDCGESLSSKAQSMENIRSSPSDSTCDDIPDVKNWTVEQVFGYFQKQFPNEAFVFKDQEIDGRSLLLLKRGDVVKKLPLKLGPSLRIYSVILKMQSQLNDPTLGWNCTL